jgi:biopolymer transport protein ExbB/TolQ
MGILGQCHGIYEALSVIARAREISPAIVAQGYAESFTTTMAGLWILVFSSIAWFALHARLRHLLRLRESEDRTE